jgi:Calpain family cysteine protease
MNAISAASSLAQSRATQLNQAHLSSRDRTSEIAGASPIQSMLQQLSGAASVFEQGAILRALDNATGGRRATDALLRGEAPDIQRKVPTDAVKSVPAPSYTDANLYGASGPLASDIQQDDFGDCYFVATLGAVAQENPDAIRNAISYDASTASFNVTLFDQAGSPQTINVTQAEIAENVRLNGGSTMDNTGTNARSWPAVMETAFAKMNDKNPDNGLVQGYEEIRRGGWPADAMRTVTGNAGSEVKFSQGFFESRTSALDEMGTSIATALANDQPVTAWSIPERDSRSLWGQLTGSANPQDGLADNHVYTVQAMEKDANGNWQVTLRNPWGHNVGVGEGKDQTSASMTIPLSELVSTGGLNSFRVGN